MFPKALALHPLGLRDRIALVDRSVPVGGLAKETAGAVCLAGEIHHLIGLSVQKSQGLTCLEHITHSVLAIVRPGGDPLSEDVRGQIWRAFGVPVLAVLMDSNGTVIAQECLAGQGLHVAPGTRWERGAGGMLSFRKSFGIWPSREHTEIGISGTILEAPCRCGKPGLRIELRRSRKSVPARVPVAIAASDGALI